MTRATTVPPVSGSGLGAAAPSRLGRAATQSGANQAGSAALDAEDACRAAWSSLASWLRNGRLERGMSIADVARTTKIQARILEDLEEALTEGLPADVFVRGFVRNYARCVGLSEAEAQARYAACSRNAGPVASPAATAVAEMYAPATRRMSTVVPVAPGSPAAEVHAQGRPLGPRYARAATAPSVLSSSPRLPRAMTDRGAELAPELLEQPPRDARELREPLRGGVHSTVRVTAEPIVVSGAVVYPRPTGSGLTAAVDAAAVGAAPVVPERAAAITPMQSMPALGSEAVAQAAPPLAAESAESAAAGHQHEWPNMVGGQSRLSAKKRRNKKRKEREAREARNDAAAAAVRTRAETVRAPIESEIFESEDEGVSQVSVAGEISGHVDHVFASSGEALHRASMTTSSDAASAALSDTSLDASSDASLDASIASAATPVRQEGWPGAAAVEAAAAQALTDEPAAAEVWIPRMPPAPRPSRSFQAPTLTIDDADPESASQLQDDRARDRDGREPTRRTFLPPILLESQDRANRQGGLTLAVIILLIAATLTLSYLMRRPSSAGGGMTQLDAPVMQLLRTETFVG